MDLALAASRLLLLIEQLKTEAGEPLPHGWKTRTASRLDMDNSLLGRLLTGERTSTSAGTISRAQTAMRLRDEFFWQPMESPPHYRDYVGGPSKKNERPVRYTNPADDTVTVPRVVYQLLCSGRLGAVSDSESALLQTYFTSLMSPSDPLADRVPEELEDFLEMLRARRRRNTEA